MRPYGQSHGKAVLGRTHLRRFCSCQLSPASASFISPQLQSNNRGILQFLTNRYAIHTTNMKQIAYSAYSRSSVNSKLVYSGINLVLLSCSITLLCVLTVHGKFSVVYKFLLAYLLTLGVSHVMRSINVRYLLTYLLKSLPTSDVVKATILRPRPQPRRPKVISPEAKAFRAHGVVSRAEIKIRSTSDHLIG